MSLNILIFLILILTTSIAGNATETYKLDLVSAVPISSVDRFQPSGLTICNGRLLTVSDKHNEIYEIIEAKDEAKARVFLSIQESSVIPEQDLPLGQALIKWLDVLVKGEHYDWEGIACDSKGKIALLSESHSSVAIINPTGRIEWLSADLFTRAHEAGMLNKYNVGFEGITWHRDKLYVVAEREPRGFVVIEKVNAAWQVTLAQTNKERVLQERVNRVRSEDFTGLASDGERIYTLERNASAICDRHDLSFTARECWSYLEVETSPFYIFANDKYGLAEGIAITDDYLYIVLDNNEDTRRKDKDDNRSLLLKFSFPRATRNH